MTTTDLIDAPVRDREPSCEDLADWCRRDVADGPSRSVPQYTRGRATA